MSLCDFLPTLVVRIFADREEEYIKQSFSERKKNREREGKGGKGVRLSISEGGGGDGGMTVDHRNHASIGGKGEGWRLVGRLAWNGRLEQEYPLLYAFFCITFVS